MRARPVVLAAALVLAPLGARAADLVVWWDKGSTPRRTRRSGRSSPPSSRKTGKQVELVLPSPTELPDKLLAALEAGQPPDFAFGVGFEIYSRQWAFEDRLVDLSDTVGHFSDLFDPDALDRVRCSTRRPGERPCTRCRWAARNHVHVWKSLLERAGFTLADIPKEWEAFWSFWCDKVQPAVRKALGRDDIWGVGLPMSAEAADTADRVLPVRGCLRGGLRDPRRPAGDRRPGGPAQARQGDRQLHGDLPQGLHPARFGDLGRLPATTRRSWRRRSS